MRIFTSQDELLQTIHPSGDNPSQAAPSVVSEHIDDLIATFVFSENEEIKQTAASAIRQAAKELSITSTSILPFYSALGKRLITSDFTVPAINVRALTYDTATLLFQLMDKHAIGPLVFEIAKSEMKYTKQRPFEYTTVILAAAIKAGYSGPVFIQGDHFQLNHDNFTSDPENEVTSIENLIKESLDAGFFNIDIDASTLVDLSKTTLSEQQRHNSEVTARLTKFIRDHEPKDMAVSIGGEIGHIGGRNSTPEDFEAFMNGYIALVTSNGISKVSVQTGSSHGGIPLPDGTIKKAAIDFSVLSEVGELARDTYHMAGAVQHGASTLPLELFSEFPKHNTAEIHLATGFQNIVFDTIPSALRDEMYHWLTTNKKDEWKEDYNKEQFLYKTRKHTLGVFKQQLWSLRAEEKQPILQALTTQFETIFEKLNMYNTKEVLGKHID